MLADDDRPDTKTMLRCSGRCATSRVTRSGNRFRKVARIVACPEFYRLLGYRQPGIHDRLDLLQLGPYGHHSGPRLHSFGMSLCLRPRHADINEGASYSTSKRPRYRATKPVAAAAAPPTPAAAAVFSSPVCWRPIRPIRSAGCHSQTIA